MYAGPVSDFLPSPHSDSTVGDTDEHLAIGCQTAGTSCTPELKTTKDGEEYFIKVIEIPQPAGRYPPQRRVAVSYFNKKWYAFINVSEQLKTVKPNNERGEGFSTVHFFRVSH